MLQDKKAVIFDLDGTLVDSMWMWKDIDIEFLGARDIAVPEDLQDCIEGMSFPETARYTIGRFGLTETQEEVIEIWNDMAYEKYAREVGFKPGAEQFLKYCKESHIPMGIATSNTRRLVEAVAASCGLFDYIDVVVTSCEVNKGKPAPDVYLKAASELAVMPENCLVFEDVCAGIQAGKNAGMTVCAVEDLFSFDKQKEKKALADYYITTYEQVLNGTYETLEKMKEVV